MRVGRVVRRPVRRDGRGSGTGSGRRLPKAMAVSVKSGLRCRTRMGSTSSGSREAAARWVGMNCSKVAVQKASVALPSPIVPDVVRVRTSWRSTARSRCGKVRAQPARCRWRCGTTPRPRG